MVPPSSKLMTPHQSHLQFRRRLKNMQNMQALSMSGGLGMLPTVRSPMRRLLTQPHHPLHESEPPSSNIITPVAAVSRTGTIPKTPLNRRAGLKLDLRQNEELLSWSGERADTSTYHRTGKTPSYVEQKPMASKMHLGKAKSFVESPACVAGTKSVTTRIASALKINAKKPATIDNIELTNIPTKSSFKRKRLVSELTSESTLFNINKCVTTTKSRATYKRSQSYHGQGHYCVQKKTFVVSIFLVGYVSSMLLFMFMFFYLLLIFCVTFLI